MILGLYAPVFYLLSLTTALAVHPHSLKYGFSNPQTIHEFPNPTWVENIAVRQNGQILVNLLTSPDIYLLDPYPSTTATLIHHFSAHLGLVGITETSLDKFHLVANNITIIPFNVPNGTDSIYTLDLTYYNTKINTGARIHEVVQIPESGILNGLSTLSAEKGLIVAADSIKGYIWLIDVNTGTYSILLQDEALSPPLGSSALGINGIKVLPPYSSDGDDDDEIAWIYFDNVAKSTFNRIPISLSTLKSIAPIQLLASNITADDFALDPERGFAYLASSNINQVFRIPLEGGSPEYVFGGLNSTVVPEPTSVTAARGGDGEEVAGRIYVVTGGGILNPINGTYTEGGKVVSYKLGW